MLRVTLYPYHWLTAGLDGDIQVIAEGTRVFAPLKLDAGVNVGVYAPVEQAGREPATSGRKRCRCSRHGRT